MTKKIKKGSKGSVSKFISRAKAVKRLDMSLKDFRRLCILKGVFPRQPSKNVTNNHKTFYHVKDITFMASDPIVNYFREKKIYRKKLVKAIARRDLTEVQHLKSIKPRLDLNHLIRERYPTFDDALKDLDDPLTMISLIAKFPGHRLFKVTPQQVELSKILLLMLKSFVVKNNLLRKVFLSIKGVYFQVEIQGQRVTWIEPYPFVTTLPFDIDYKIMLSFTEIYQVLLKFVIFRLFSQKGFVYPPSQMSNFEPDRRDFQSTNTFLNFQLVEREIEKNEEEADEFKNIAKPNKVTSLFDNFVFFLSTEVQKDLFEFIILSFKGTIIYVPENFGSELYLDNRITHVISDRKLEQIPMIPNREYVQPQWLVDSLNFGVLLPTKDYLPGSSLPPHLSPFIDDEKAGFVTQRKKEILESIGEYVEESIDESEEDEVEKKNPESTPSPAYKVKEEVYEMSQVEKSKQVKQVKETKEKGELQKLMLTKKRQRLLEKIQNFDEAKKEKVKQIIARKKELKKAL